MIVLNDLATSLQPKHQHLTRTQIYALISDFIEEIKTRLKKGEKIKVNHLGIFEVKQYKAKTGRNPATGESVEIKATKKLVLKVTKTLRDELKELKD